MGEFRNHHCFDFIFFIYYFDISSLILEMPLKRLFFAIDISVQDKGNIDHWRSNIEFTGKMVKAKNLHITLAFLGEKSAPNQQNIVEKINVFYQPASSSPIIIHAEHIHSFDRAKVICLGFSHFDPRLN